MDMVQPHYNADKSIAGSMDSCVPIVYHTQPRVKIAIFAVILKIVDRERIRRNLAYGLSSEENCCDSLLSSPLFRSKKKSSSFTS